MIGFSQENLGYFRQIGKLVKLYDMEGTVETALFLSGSAT
jgi:hypothetical protein